MSLCNFGPGRSKPLSDRPLWDFCDARVFSQDTHGPQPRGGRETTKLGLLAKGKETCQQNGLCISPHQESLAIYVKPVRFPKTRWERARVRIQYEGGMLERRGRGVLCRRLLSHKSS